MAEKPAVLIIGGLGYIGRFLALHIRKNNLASEVRIVDKVLPQLAWLAPEFAEACSQDKFMQADASKERTLHILSFFNFLFTYLQSLTLWTDNTSSFRESASHFRPLQWQAMGLRIQLRR